MTVPADLVQVVAEAVDAVNLVTNPIPNVTLGVPPVAVWGTGGAGTHPTATTYRRMQWTTAPTTPSVAGHDLTPHLSHVQVKAGAPYSVRVRARRNRVGTQATVGIQFLNGTGNVVGESWDTQTFTSAAFRNFVIHGTVAPDTAERLRVLAYCPPGSVQAGDYLDYQQALVIQAVTAPGAFFYGDTTDSGAYRYRWDGIPHRAESLRVTDQALPGLHSISTTRGGRAGAGSFLQVEPGTATIAVAGDWSHIRPGAPVRVSHRQVDVALFTGHVQDCTTTYAKDRGDLTARTTLTATDHVATVNNTMRYGVAVDSQTLGNRVAQLMTSAPEVTYSTGSVSPVSAPVRHAAVVYESTLGNHLDLVANTSAVVWFVDRDNAVRFTRLNLGGPAQGPALTDGSVGVPGWRLLYNDIQVSRTTRGSVTSVTLENHARQPDPDNPGNWLADDRNVGPYVDADAEAATGRRAATIPTAAMGTPGQLTDQEAWDALGQFWSTQFRPRKWPTWARVNALCWFDVNARGWSAGAPTLALGAARLTDALTRDISNALHAGFDGVRYPCYIAGIRHTITPTSWHVEYDLAAIPTYLLED